jgi:hypothetical protein
MGIGDRDYMRKTSEDEKRIQSFEDDRFEQEYGEAPEGKGERKCTGAFWIVALLALLAVAVWLLSR